MVLRTGWSFDVAKTVLLKDARVKGYLMYLCVITIQIQTGASILHHRLFLTVRMTKITPGTPGHY